MTIYAEYLADAGCLPPGWATLDDKVKHREELDEVVAETMSLFARQPEAKEIVVDAARGLREAERNGTYAEKFAMVNR
jgi:short-subunit dehydrogenase involved in D-alanine esterification of teichoic acids